MAAAVEPGNAPKQLAEDVIIRLLRVVMPDATIDVLAPLMEYAKSASVTCSADICKLEESKLSAILGAEKAKQLLVYCKNEAAANVLDNGRKPWTVEDIMRHVRVVIPDITIEVFTSLLEYARSAGVTSEADIEKIDGSKLSAIVGGEKAKALLDYFRKEALTSKNLLCHEVTSAVTAPSADIISAAGGGCENMGEIFKILLETQRRGNEQNMQMMMRMQTMQEQFLGTVSQVMVETSSMVKGTLQKMSEQMTEQSRMHQETLAAMQETTAAASKMNEETMRAVQLGITEARKMNSETTDLVRQSMADMLEAQRQSAQRIEAKIHTPPSNDCVIL